MRSLYHTPAWLGTCRVSQWLVALGSKCRVHRKLRQLVHRVHCRCERFTCTITGLGILACVYRVSGRGRE